MSEQKAPTMKRWPYLSASIPLRPSALKFVVGAFVITVALLTWTKYDSFSQTLDNLSYDWSVCQPDIVSSVVEPAVEAQPEESHNGTNAMQSLLPLKEAESLCAKHEMKPYPRREGHRKVYDLFLVGTELDWTEIRLNELAPYVDYFVILEAENTFTNQSKPKYFKKNWKHFSQFESKIIYHVLNEDAIRHEGNPWQREKYQRNALVTQVFPNLLGDKAPQMGDVIMVSDVDELPRPETITKLRNCDIPARTGLQSRFFLYSFQLRRTDMEWYHPQATFWQGEKTILPESLRMDGVAYQFGNASWHCTNCFSTVADFVTKIKSFSHTDYNKPEFADPDEIVRRVRNGLDVFDRDYPYQRVESKQMDAPRYVIENRRKFGYLVDRDPPNANLYDYSATDDQDGYDKSEVDDSLVPYVPGS
ncbi:hypothetical protein LTR64_004877 [Lithohypha guttulata]|uniref:uncharacterized protein n=1 Tax=Lithohypha guttulata TaxID=1690604 RepID=UPI002DE195BD|nr:hypothetical protein LTR51_005286 [Lithohypha guttulata]